MDEAWSRNVAAFRQLLPQLLETYPRGKYVLIRNAELVDVFDSLEEAASAGSARQARYFVKEIKPLDEEAAQNSH